MAELEDESSLASNDPFSPESSGAWLLVMAMRNYDVQVAILSRLEDMQEAMTGKKISADHKASDIIYDAHQKGHIVSDFPKFTPPPSEAGTDE